ncbi:MAG: HlyC/CorC family transporter [Sedimentisphaerales bacterium]|nr:HlyC/CorC family transporter [Sedimentisphaerales bacterium]
MTVFIENIGHILLLVILLCFSAFFSGSETAFFNLTKKQISQLRHSRHKFSTLAGHVVSNPRQLLSSLLLGNMTVNVLYFATSSLLILRIEKQAGVTVATIAGIMIFILLLICGEILPKSISYSSSVSISIIAAAPAYALVSILKPIVSAFQFLIITPFLRLMMGHIREPKPMSTDEFQSLAEQIKRSGLITDAENKLLAEISELHILKVRHCLKPRVDILACEINESTEQIREKIEQHKLTKIPVYEQRIDNIIGFIYLRDLLTRPSSRPADIYQAAYFVPEQKSVESMVEHFRKTGTDTAIVVDEYGGLAGQISLEDIADEIFGPIEGSEEIEPVEQLGPMEYRLAGSTAVHEWGKSFGVNFPQARYSTVGGLVTALLGKIPKSGDTARLGNLLFTVERVQKNRIITVVLKLEPLASDVN